MTAAANSIGIRVTPVQVDNGGTSLTTLTSNSLYVGNGTGAPTALGAATNGQIPIGSTGAAPVVAAITAGTGISVTNGAGSITIANTATSFATVNQTASTVTMAVNTQYINTSAANAQVTYTIPAVAAQGSIFRIVGVTGNSGGWVLQANTGQTVWVAGSVTTTAGTITSAAATDVIDIVCTVADTVFVSTSAISAGFTVA